MADKPVDSSGQTSADKIAAAQKRLAKTRALKAQGVTFKYSPAAETIYAYDKAGSELGYMALNPANKHGDREIKMVHVNENARSKGVASGLFTEAQKQGLKPMHSSSRSPLGEDFAKSTGTYVPPKNTKINNFDANDYQAQKRVNKGFGQREAQRIAIERATGRVSGSSPLSGFGRLTGGVIGYLPMLAQAGQIATGRDQALQRQLAVLRQPQ